MVEGSGQGSFREFAVKEIDVKDDNKVMIERVYQLFADRDFEAVLSHFAADFEWYAADNSPLADMSPYNGIDAIRTGVFARIEAGFESLAVVADEIFEAEGGKVVVLGYYHGKFRGKADGFRTQVAHIWTLRDGRAVKFQQYLDTLKVSRDAAGSAAVT
jgi:ketosteroid isomerase-like protein